MAVREIIITNNFKLTAMAQTIKQRYLKSEKIDWRTIRSLQPVNLKLTHNNNWLTQSHDKFGIVDALHVWEDKENNIVYALDGHQRIEEYHSREDIPDKIWAHFYRASSKEEAVQILLEVFNQKHNPIDARVMTEWLELEEIPIREVAVQSLNIMVVDEEEEGAKPGASAPSDSTVIKLEYPEGEAQMVRDALAHIAHTPEAAVWQLLKLD